MTTANWDEIRTAFHVARAGTVSGAAETLGVHHATVIRHIDALEQALGVKLFQRHPRGYTATEAGLDLLQVAQATEDQFSQLAGRLRGQGDSVSGELVVTSIPGLSQRLTPALLDFAAENPGLRVRLKTSEEVLRLEYGEAHVAVRAGPRPGEPDNVVQPLATIRVTLYASKDYLDRRGSPASLDDLDGHSFVLPDARRSRSPFNRWLSGRIAPEQVVFTADDEQALGHAVVAGAGIGFLSDLGTAGMPGVRAVVEPLPDWDVPLWLVTHVDLHRTTKVQACLAALKAAAATW